MDEERIADVNPDQLPLTVGQNTSSRQEIKYPSASKAFWAGARRGAKFGGKWAALAVGAVLGAINLGTFVLWLCLIYLRPTSDVLWYSLQLLKIAGLSVVAVAYAALVTAAVGAVSMGTGEWVSYRRAKKSANATTIT
jgi:hypothetical protein